MTNFKQFEQVGEVIHLEEAAEEKIDAKIQESMKTIEGISKELNEMKSSEIQEQPPETVLEHIEHALGRICDAFKAFFETIFGGDESGAEADATKVDELANKFGLELEHLKDLQNVRHEFEDMRQQLHALRDNQIRGLGPADISPALNNIQVEISSLSVLFESMSETMVELRGDSPEPVTSVSDNPNSSQFDPEPTTAPWQESESFDNPTQEVVDALRDIPGLQPEVWDGYDASEKLDTLQSVEYTLAEYQDRPALSVVADIVDNPSIYGSYDGDTIHINAIHIYGETTVIDMTNTVAHEGRHAFQDYATNHTEVLEVSSVTVEAWQDNMENYLSADQYGYEAYYNQPVEADARNWADSLIDEI